MGGASVVDVARARVVEIETQRGILAELDGELARLQAIRADVADRVMELQCQLMFGSEIIGRVRAQRRAAWIYDSANAAR